MVQIHGFVGLNVRHERNEKKKKNIAPASKGLILSY